MNFGGGLDYRFNDTRAIRGEIRDYYAPSAPSQHNVAMRVGLVIYIDD